MYPTVGVLVGVLAGVLVGYLVGAVDGAFDGARVGARVAEVPDPEPAPKPVGAFDGASVPPMVGAGVVAVVGAGVDWQPALIPQPKSSFVTSKERLARLLVFVANKIGRFVMYSLNLFQLAFAVSSLKVVGVVPPFALLPSVTRTTAARKA